MVDFYICADKLDFIEINSSLNIWDAKIRESNSFIHKEFAKDYWSIDTGYEILEDASEQIEKILNRLQHKVAEINNIKEMFNADCGFVITIKSEEESIKCGIYYGCEFINFVSSVGGDISMDFC